MAFELPAFPNFNVQVPDLTQKALEGAQLRNMMSEMALRKALAPGQVQLQQQQIQSATTANELQQMQLQGQRALADWLKNGDASADVPAGDFSNNDRIATFVGVRPNDPIMNVVRSMAKHNVPAPMLVTEAQGMLQRRTEYFKGTKEEQDAQKSDRLFWEDQLTALHNMPEDQRSAQLAAKLPLLQENSKADPLLAKYAAGLAGHPELIDPAYNAVVGENAVLGLRQKIAETTKAEQAVAPPSATQLSTFTKKTLPAFGALRPEQKAAFTAEAQTARTVDELNKVIERADATDKAEQMHRDSLAQTEALKGQTFAQAGLKENDKTWTDPQHGYLQTLTQANLGKAAIKAGADGNGLMTSLEPTMVALGVSSFAGVHRVPPAEAQAAGAPGGWAERFNAWATKATQGKLSKEVAKEGQELFDDMIAAKHQSSVQASAMHAQGFNIPPKNMPVMDREGNLTTLDKVSGGKAAGGEGGQAPKSLTAAQITAYAQANGVSEDEVRRQAKAKGIGLP